MCRRRPRSLPLLTALFLLTATATTAAGPSWLGGTPDAERRPDRCAVYEWFFARLKRQTDQPVEIDALARDRLLNIANKLVEHHGEAPQPEYAAEIRYLLFGGGAPVHFSFAISADELERLLRQPCR